MDVFTRVDGPVPENLAIKQVYGILFTRDGRIMLRKEDGHFSFAGGKPEKFDDGLKGTLRRECIEEVNTTLTDKIQIVGYQLVNEGNSVPPYAQLRMVALIDTIGEKKPDPDGGKIYDRLLTSPENAITLLNWGEVGKSQVLAALKIAKQEFGIKEFSTKEEYV